MVGDDPPLSRTHWTDGSMSLNRLVAEVVFTGLIRTNSEGS